jgi:CheY-like chemotaxis protein
VEDGVQPALVLIVDDDPDFVYLLGAALIRRGALVESTTSAFGLVSRVAGITAQRRPDIVVLDCGLPALSGTSALSLLAKNAKAAEIPVMLVSAAPPDDVNLRLAAHPRARFVNKNGHFNALAESVLAQATEKPR